ncbi:MAG: hypothetical protein LBM26_05570 [Methanobrevibacter sp.]|jgi:hypothetical protein|nr:hypothetical protein [Methanobrevibacter sp.]
MDIIGIAGKSDVDYVFPNFEKAKEVDWKADIAILSDLGAKVILVDEFLVDGYDWDLLSEILNNIKESGAISGLITSFPFKTTKKLINSPIKNDFDFYMVPINKLGYMIDTESFMAEEREELSNLLQDLDKRIIANKTLACGIQQPKDAFNFLKTLDYIDMVSVGIGSEKEAEDSFNILKDI